MQPMKREGERAAHYLITDAEYQQILTLQRRLAFARTIIVALTLSGLVGWGMYAWQVFSVLGGGL